MNKAETKLIKDIEKKCTTIMIGSIARFEKTFSHLWDSDTAKSDAYYDTWQETRHDILNFGNYQIREAMENLYQYFIEKKKSNKQYSYEFHVKNKIGDNTNEN